MVTTLSDVEVVLDVLKPAIPENLGMLAIFVPKSEKSYTSYSALEDLTTDIEDEEVVAIANNYFAQDGHGEKLAIIGYDDIVAAANEYSGKGWEFATVAAASKAANAGTADEAVVGQTEAASGTAKVTTEAEDLMALSNWVEGQNRGFVVLGLPATSETVSGPKQPLKRTTAIPGQSSSFLVLTRLRRLVAWVL